MAKSLSKQLANIRSKVPSTKDPFGTLKNPMEIGQDNVDHINMFAHGDSTLGRYLSMSSNVELRHSIFKTFSCVDSFRYWISSVERDDSIRTMKGKRLFAFARTQTQARVTNFRAIVLDANYQRIMQNKPLVEALIDSTLPLDCYRVDRDTGLRIRPPFAKWFIWGMEEIRKALKADREPNFDILLDRKGTKIYEFVTAGLKIDEPAAEEALDEAAPLEETIQPEGDGVEVDEIPEGSFVGTLDANNI